MRFCTESSTAGQNPLFFIGSSPSMAAKIINPSAPAAGVMVSANTLKKRKSDFQVGNWIMDSGAFTEVARHGGYRCGVEQYVEQIQRWSCCGNLLIAVSQDWMCEPFVTERTGLNIETHQRLTIERYDELVTTLNSDNIPIMPVLQGYRSSDYLKHLQDYGSRLWPGQWVGVGSVCRRNGNPDEVANILKGIKLLRPDLRLHGFGLKLLALEHPEIRDCLYSCDSMAWSYPLRFAPGEDFAQNRTPVDVAHEYQIKVQTAVDDSVQKRVPRTAGAGNGQGRKRKWSNQTVPCRFPVTFKNGKTLADLEAIARSWDK